MATSRYVDTRKVAEGAFGAVLEATDRLTGSRVAVKRIPVHQQIQGVLREIHALQQLRCRGVVPLLDATPQGSALLLAMPLVPCSLATVIGLCNAPLHEAHVASLSRMLLLGLAAIHAEGLLHRDVKPANVLVAPSGLLMFADFGQARDAPTRREQTMSHAVAVSFTHVGRLYICIITLHICHRYVIIMFTNLHIIHTCCAIFRENARFVNYFCQLRYQHVINMT